MKREEAIKLIDTHTVCFYNEIDSPTLQALHLAIEALSEPKHELPEYAEWKGAFDAMTRPSGDLISRAAAIEAVRMSEHRITIADEQGGVGTVKWDMWGVYTAEAVEAIKALPSADRPSGEWQRVDEQPYFRKHYHKMCCSVCHKQGSEKYNFCPNCGARMGGAE